MIGNCFDGYWDGQASGFAEITEFELKGQAHAAWQDILRDALPPGGALRILDVGCGAGFFGIMLCRMGHSVTETDRSEKMLRAAQDNLSRESNRELVKLVCSDAQRLPFPDSQFDVVISRDVSWALPEPQRAYREWLRVLKPGGTLLNFDGNWFLHRFDEKAKADYEAGTALVLEAGLPLAESDHSGEVDAFIDALPLSRERRPQWDIRFLQSLDCGEIQLTEALPDHIYDEYYRLQYRYVPTFLIKVKKQKMPERANQSIKYGI